MPTERQVQGVNGSAAAIEGLRGASGNDEGWTDGACWGAAPRPQGRSGNIRHVAPGIARSRAFRLWLEIHGLVENPREAGNPYRCRTTPLERADTGLTRCSARQHVIHQDNSSTLERRGAPWVDGNCPRKRPAASFLAQSAKRRRGPGAHERIDHYSAMTKCGQFLRQKGRLIVTPLPEAMPMQRHRNEHALRV